VPAPRCVTRESQLTARTEPTATRVRSVSGRAIGFTLSI
jgi:hypothetical protein